jgi:hypothetical protein
MSEIVALKKDIEDLKKQVEYLSGKVEYLSFWNGIFVKRSLKAADERAAAMRVKQSIPGAHPEV